MTDQTATTINIVLVQIVFGGRTYDPIPFADLVAEFMPQASPATISDADLIRAAARFVDRSAEDFSDHIVSRPDTGGFLVGPKPVYGED